MDFWNHLVFEIRKMAVGFRLLKDDPRPAATCDDTAAGDEYWERMHRERRGMALGVHTPWEH